MIAALDRCRSYRDDTDPDCTIIALNNELISKEESLRLDTRRVASMYFRDEGFIGSQQARLSYAPNEHIGHIWLVDTANGRDCKGEWKADGDDGTWWMLCKDGLRAEGTISSPATGSGSGVGKTSNGDLLRFTFEPDE